MKKREEILQSSSYLLHRTENMKDISHFYSSLEFFFSETSGFTKQNTVIFFYVRETNNLQIL